MTKIYRVYLTRQDHKYLLVEAEDEYDAYNLADLACLRQPEDGWECSDLEEIGEAPSDS